MRLANVAVVLVRTRNPLNIGAAARAMQNFGVLDLRLVEPFEASFREARSAVGAGDLLEQAREFATVAAAVADCQLVAGTTAARRRQLLQPLVDLDAVAGVLAQVPGRDPGRGRVALLFGSEKHGLTREDMDHCHLLLRIPTDAAQPSMNLGQAVAVCLWELARPRGAGDDVRDGVKVAVGGSGQAGTGPNRATSGEAERLTGVLMELLEAGGYTQPKTREATEGEVRRMLRRLQVGDGDAQLLLGMVRRLLWRLRAADARGSVTSE